MGQEEEGATSEAGGCFGCASGNRRGLALEFRRRGEEVVAETVLDASFAGYDGLAHGGIVATILDEAMGWAILELTGHYAVTRRLQVDFRRPVATGKPLTIHARLASAASDTSVRVTAEVADSRGRLLASATGEWARLRAGRVRKIPAAERR